MHKPHLLTVRRLEVVSWIARGKSNEEIAEILGLSKLTVKNHVQTLLRCYGVAGRVQVAVAAVLRGDIDRESLAVEYAQVFAVAGLARVRK